MNRNSNKRRTISFTIFILVIGLLSTIYSEADLAQNEHINPISSDNATKIHINETNSTLDWDNCPWVNGSGTMGDPYILKDLIIDAGGIGSPIVIENSRKYFRIINCTLSGAEKDIYPNNFGGIKLLNCSNGVIRNVTCHFNIGNGIFVEDSNNITITESNISKNENHGILFYYSDSIIVHNNTFMEGGYHGVHSFDSDNINITFNFVYNQENSGIYVNTCRNHTVIDNIVNLTGWVGIHARISTNTNITNNTIIGSEWAGVYLEQVEYSIINKNKIINCRDGIDLISCVSANYIFDNIINSTNYIGMRIFDSYDTEISNNSLYHAFLRFHTTLDSILSTNISSDNFVNDKPLRYYEDQDWITPPENTGQLIAVQCNFVNLTAFPHSNFGVGLYYSNHSFINGSNLMQLEIGYSINATVTNNIGFSQGMYLRYVNESVIRNNTCCFNIAGYDRGIGIKLYYGDNNLITENNCSYNNYGGIWLQYANNNTVSWNECHDNIGGGLYDGKGICSSGLTTWGTNYIQNNFCYRNKMGIRVDSSYTVVRDNILIDNLKHAIYSGGGGATSPLINNTCEYNDEFAIQGSNDYGILINNTCNNNIYNGIVLTGDYVTLDGNNCSYNHDDGIKIGTGAPYCYAINNYMKGNWNYGLYVQNSINSTLVNNTCIYNYYDNIYVDSSSDGTGVIGNNCTSAIGNTDSGIRIAYADNCIIVNNSCFENGEAGIYVIYSNSCLIYGNNCSNNQAYDGIWLDHSNYCSIYENNCSYNNRYGIYIADSMGCEVYLNFGVDNGISNMNIGGNLAYDNFWGFGPHAWFSVNSSSIVEGQYVEFTDKSFNGIEGEGPFTYQYNFSDGSVNSTKQNPVHRFLTPGAFTVILTINDTKGSPSVYIKEIYVAEDMIPTAFFNVNATTIYQYQSIAFMDSTINGNEPFLYQWDFDDGTEVGKEQNPIHMYTKFGDFMVTLMVVDANGDVSIATKGITVIEELFPIALFSVNATIIEEKEFVQFTDMTIGGNPTLNYQWNFGDGSPNSNLTNPMHQFSIADIYLVILTVNDSNGDISIFSMQITVNIPFEPPIIETGGDIKCEITSSAYISFTISDPSTSSPYYCLYRDSTIVRINIQWISGQEITYLVSSISIGIHNFTVVAYDGLGFQASKTIWVEIINQKPEIDISFGIYDTKSIGNVLEVIITDPSTIGPYYTLSRNGETLISYDSWLSGIQFEINIDGLDNGVYVFEITAYDGVGGISTESITIRVYIYRRIGLSISLAMIISTLTAMGAAYVYLRYFKKK